MFTLSEIRQQPDLWPDTLEKVRRHPARALLPDREVLFCGAGTSAYAAEAVAAGWPRARAIPSTDVLLSSRHELLRSLPCFAQRGLAVSIARSGDSPESLAVVTRLQEIFPAVPQLAITCNKHGGLANLERVQSIILDERANDRSLVMTSSFSNLTLAGLALLHAEILGLQLPVVAQTTRAAMEYLSIEAEKLAAAKFGRVVVLASPELRPLATEACLKILEMTAGRSVALPETFLGLRHGPMSFLREDSLVIAFLSSDPHKRRYEEDLLLELSRKKLGLLVAVGASQALKSVCKFIPANAPQLPDYLRVPFEIVFPQLLACQMSIAIGVDPDNPSPDGVITRVVQKFQLHQETA